MEVAIQKDCEAIIEGFILSENPRFESFVRQWKSASFQRIYTAQSSSTEIIQSTDTCIHYGKRVLTYKTALSKLGALFLLYAIYFKQPTERSQKIDLDLDAWVKLKDFLHSLDEQHNGTAVRCMFWELFKEGAFRFVASDTYHGLENFLNLDRVRNSVLNTNKTLHAFRSEINQWTCRQGLFAGITKLEEGYSEMKELMNQTNNEDKPLAMLPVSSGFGELKAAVSSLQAFMKRNRSHRPKKDKKMSRKNRQVKNKEKKGEKKPNFRTGGRMVLR